MASQSPKLELLKMWGEELTCEQVHHHDHHDHHHHHHDHWSSPLISRAGCLGRLRQLHRSEGEQGGGESGANPMVRWEHESGDKSHRGQIVTGAILLLQLIQQHLTLPSILLLQLSFQYCPHQVNKLGVLTINSQPSAHCVPRLIPSDKSKILDLTPFGQFGHKYFGKSEHAKSRMGFSSNSFYNGLFCNSQSCWLRKCKLWRHTGCPKKNYPSEIYLRTS